MLSTPPPPHRGPVHTDALQVITEVTATLQHSLLRLENLQKLMELQRDLVGVENLVSPGRVSDPAGGGVPAGDFIILNRQTVKVPSSGFQYVHEVVQPAHQAQKIFGPLKNPRPCL